jgi:uncharacterized membrane protein YjgN (DUF898 family)
MRKPSNIPIGRVMIGVAWGLSMIAVLSSLRYGIPFSWLAGVSALVRSLILVALVIVLPIAVFLIETRFFPVNDDSNSDAHIKRKEK